MNFFIKNTNDLDSIENQYLELIKNSVIVRIFKDNIDIYFDNSLIKYVTISVDYNDCMKLLIIVKDIRYNSLIKLLSDKSIFDWISYKLSRTFEDKDYGLGFLGVRKN